MDERRFLWHIVAVIATLALSVVVAVVAVTRDDPHEPSAAESPSPSPSVSPTESPGGLHGEGPYVVYVDGFDVVAFDVSTGDVTRLGMLRDDPVPSRSWQPGTGRVVAFATVGGDIWSVTRRGTERVGAIPSDAGTSFDGSAASVDDRKLAVAVIGPVPSIVVVDLQSGRPTVIERPQRGEYPRDRPFLPIAWSFGGTVLYGIPYCEGCSPGDPGLFAFDVEAGTSTRVAGTATEVFYTGRVAVSPSGQAIYFGNARERRCRPGEVGSCEGPPFYLRRLAAGQRGSTVLEEGTDAHFFVDAISPDGRLLLVRRPLSEREGARLEFYDAEGDRRSGPRGIPAGGAAGVALLPREVLVLRANAGALIVVREGEARTIAEPPAAGGSGAVYLGWLL